MENKKQLEVGDYVYTYERYGNGVSRYQIDRITPKRAFVNYFEFHRDIIEMFATKGNLGCKGVGRNSNCYIETTKLLSRYTTQQKIKKAKNLYNDFNPNIIDEQTADLFINFFEPLKTKKDESNIKA